MTEAETQTSGFAVRNRTDGWEQLARGKVISGVINASQEVPMVNGRSSEARKKRPSTKKSSQKGHETRLDMSLIKPSTLSAESQPSTEQIHNPREANVHISVDFNPNRSSSKEMERQEQYSLNTDILSERSAIVTPYQHFDSSYAFSDSNGWHPGFRPTITLSGPFSDAHEHSRDNEPVKASRLSHPWGVGQENPNFRGALPSIWNSLRWTDFQDGSYALGHGLTHLGPPLKPFDGPLAEARALEQWRIVKHEEQQREQLAKFSGPLSA